MCSFYQIIIFYLSWRTKKRMSATSLTGNVLVYLLNTSETTISFELKIKRKMHLKPPESRYIFQIEKI